MSPDEEPSPAPTPAPAPTATPAPASAKPSVIVVVAAAKDPSAPPALAPDPASVSASDSASASVPVSASASVPVSASASASVPVPAPAQPLPEWVPPDTLNEKLSRWSRTLVKTAVTLLGLLILATFVIWLVPAVVLARSDEYRVAIEHAKQDPLLQEELGLPIHTAWSPERYEVVGPGHARVLFEASGPMGWRKVQVEVQGGLVTNYAITW